MRAVRRDVEIVFPHELTPEQRKRLAARWAEFQANRYTAPVAYARHCARRSHHMHVQPPRGN